VTRSKNTDSRDQRKGDHGATDVHLSSRSAHEST
jgi:hypothetical protein